MPNSLLTFATTTSSNSNVQWDIVKNEAYYSIKSTSHPELAFSLSNDGNSIVLDYYNAEDTNKNGKSSFEKRIEKFFLYK